VRKFWAYLIAAALFALLVYFTAHGSFVAGIG
jgi:hypothetical protein